MKIKNFIVSQYFKYDFCQRDVGIWREGVDEGFFLFVIGVEGEGVG